MVLIKKVILTNFFIFSILIWYSQINHSLLVDINPLYIFKYENITFLNIAYLLGVETIFYIWSYISFSTYLSDWTLPKPNIKEVTSIFYIAMYYLLIILYYSILFR